LEVLLVTSRDTGRWIIPKGGVAKGFAPAKAAEREAYEEAGVVGTVHLAAIGCFTYAKRRQSGEETPMTVEVYALEVARQLKKWPERDERRQEWMPISRAVSLVEESGLKMLLLRLEEIRGALSR
jgi:8-oxo-dGTP pyrophosphatase MutT (NUDIX family)